FMWGWCWLSGGLAQATAFRLCRLLQSPRRRAYPPLSDRYRVGGMAMATRRRRPERQLNATSDLRAEFRLANLLSLLDALALPRERHLAKFSLFRSDLPGANDDHPHRPSWWNPERR